MENKKLLKVLYFIFFIDYMSGSFVYPIFTFLFFSKDSTESLFPIDMPLHIKTIYFGLSISIFALGDFLGNLFCSKFSDRIGRKENLKTLLLVGCLGLLLCVLAINYKNIFLLISGRFLTGFAGGVNAILKAIIADINSLEMRFKNFSKISIIYACAYLIGPLIGILFIDKSLIKWFSAYLPFLFLSIFYFVAYLIVLFLKGLNDKKQETNHFKFFQIIQQFLKIKKIAYLFLWIFLYTCAWSVFYSTLPIELLNHFNLSHFQIGYVYSYLGFWMIIIQIAVSKKMDIWGLNTVIKWCLFTIFIIWSLSSLFFKVPFIYLLTLYFPIVACIQSTLQTCISTSTSFAVSESQQVSLQGICSSIKTLAFFIGPIIASYLVAVHDLLPIYASLILIIFAFLAFKAYKKCSI